MSSRVWVRTVTATLACTVAMAGCNRGNAESAAASGPETGLVERRTLDIRVEATGQIEPIRLVEVKSKASGEILRLHVETGDVVQAGALLAEIDPRDVRNALDQAQADLAVAQARLQTSIAQRERSEELRKANVVTQQEYENAVLDEANSRAQLVKAQTNLQLAEERMGDVTIRAPLTGTIIARQVEVGAVIQSASANISGGSTLMTMADLDEMQVRTLVDETDLGRVRSGLSARVSVEAYPSRSFEGSVIKIEPQAVVEQNVTMFPVLVRLDNREGLLKPGMNGDVQIEVARRENVVAVPNAAVVGTRDAIAAGAMLGIAEDVMQQSMRSGMRGPEAAAAPGDSAPPAGANVAAAPAASPECTALRDKLQQGGFEALTDQERQKLRECRPQGAQGGQVAGQGGQPAAGQGGQARGQGGQAGQGGQFAGAARGGRGGAGVGRGETRPGVAFVQTATGIEPRSVLLGVNDWEFTEVLRGLEPGEQVVLISVAQLQRAQQEFDQRMRERMGGFPGAGSGPRR